MRWQFLIGISIITYSFSVLLQRALLRAENSRPVAFSIFFQLIVGGLIGIFGILFVGMKLPNNLGSIWKNLLLTIILYAPFNVLVYKSIKGLEASKFSVVLSVRVLFTSFASALFLKEVLNERQILGALIIFFSVVVVNLNKNVFSFGKGFWLGLLAAAFLGLANTNDKYILNVVDLYPYVTFSFLAPAVALSLIYPKEFKNIKLFIGFKPLLKIIFLGGLFAISALTFFAALKTGGSSSQISIVYLTSIILTVLLSFIFLKETDGWLRKIAGTILNFIGLLLVI